jgi:hypothetical protein
MKNECLDVALRELDAAGVRDVARSYGSKHLQIRWQVNGSARMYSLAITPSDVRSVANTRSQIRKILREDGMLPTMERKPPAPKQPADRATILERRMVILEQQLAALSKQVVILEQQLAALSKQVVILEQQLAALSKQMNGSS